MDEQLEKLLEAACQHPEGSQEWRLAIHRLLIALQQLSGIKKSPHPDYLEALNQTFWWVSRNICQKFVSRGSLSISLVNWINGYLYWRIRDLYSSNGSSLVSLDIPIGTNKEGFLIEQLTKTNIKTPTLDGLDGYIERLQKQNTLRIAMNLELYVERDPQIKLRSCYPGNYPQCNCQLLSQSRYLQNPPNTFSSIARELNIPLTKLTNHWYGRCKPLLQAIALDLGYQPRQDNE